MAELLSNDHSVALRKMIEVFKSATTEAYKKAVRRIEFASAEKDAVPLAQISKEFRKEMFLFLAVYGGPLSTIGCSLQTSPFEQQIFTSMFAAIAFVANTGECPVEYLVHLSSVLTNFVDSIDDTSTKDSEVLQVKALLEAATLSKMYED